MENLSYVGLSHQSALKMQMETVSNNIANISTPGFKSQSVIFEEYLNGTEGNKGTNNDKLSQVIDRATWRNTEQGALQMTGNPLDVAITGQGYFSVDTPLGVQYTRAGNFTLNADRELITAQGYQVLDDDGGAIQIPQGENDILIDAQGNISTENGNVGTLGVFTFDNEQLLKQAGNGLYADGGAVAIAADETTSVQQGAIEGSNVQSVVEMTKMIEILRTYQSVQRMMQNDHDRIRSAIRTLSEVN